MDGLVLGGCWVRFRVTIGLRLGDGRVGMGGCWWGSGRGRVSEGFVLGGCHRWMGGCWVCVGCVLG